MQRFQFVSGDHHFDVSAIRKEKSQISVHKHKCQWTINLRSDLFKCQQWHHIIINASLRLPKSSS